MRIDRAEQGIFQARTPRGHEPLTSRGIASNGQKLGRPKKGGVLTARVIFFQPRTLAQANYSNCAGREQTWTPWFACFLARAAHASGFSTELVDARVARDWRELVAGVDAQTVLAVSVMTGVAIKDAIAATQLAKERGAFVVWGGPHVTLFPEQSLEQSGADAVVPTFGYLGFDALLRSNLGQRNQNQRLFMRKRGEPPHAKIGTLYHDTAIKSQKAMLFDATDDQPYLEVIRDWEPYVNADIAIGSRTVNYATSEGCARKCTFCSEPRTSAGVWYMRSIERSVEAIVEMVRQARADGLKLHDPNFFHDQERSLAFAKLLSHRAHIAWAGTLHPADLLAMNAGYLDSLSALGLSRVLIGLESPLASVVKLAGKQYDPATIPEMARRLAAARIRGMFTFIVGWPDAPPNHYDETIACAHAIRDIWHEHQCKIHFLEPWPGTPIFRMLEKRGLPCPRTLVEWAEIDYYQAQYSQLHDFSHTERIRAANAQLSPYVEA